MTPAWRQLTLLSLAELAALGLWFSAAAVLPALSREWALGDGGRAGLTIAVQAGFIVGTLASALANLPDVCSPRALMTASIVLGVVANGALALAAESLGPALVLLRPPMEIGTALLWGGPLLILLLGGIALARFYRRREVTAVPPLSAEERRRLASVLDEGTER